MTYIASPAASSLAGQEQGRLYAARLRGRGLDPVRRLRHDSISAASSSLYELDILPHQVAKLSGIGCSSKAPTYFVGASHGFNTVHGACVGDDRANLRQPRLIYMGVSGDGDSASIGLGQFATSCGAA